MKEEVSRASELFVLTGEMVDRAGCEVLDETDDTVESMDRFLAIFGCVGCVAGDMGGEMVPFTSDTLVSIKFSGEASGLTGLGLDVFADFVGEKRS